MQNLQKLYEITSDSALSYSQKMLALLQLGVDYFQLEMGIISHIEGELYTVSYAISPENDLLSGTTFNLGDTYCVHTLATNQALSFYHVGQSHIAHHPCYLNLGLESYIGAPIVVEGKRFGTINFSASRPRNQPFSNEELSFIELLSHWVGNEIARHEKLTLLKEQQKVMARQQDILEQMGQVAGVGAWELDLVDGKLYWSSVMKDIHEVEQDFIPDLVNGLNFYKEGENQTRITECVRRLMDHGGNFSGEFEIITQKGTPKWAAVKGKAELDEGKCVRLVGAFQDITEQVNSREQLVQRHKELSLALEARSLFLANMSHEIRTPINGVLGMLQILEASALDTVQLRFLGLAKDSATSLLGIINDILDFTKIDSGKLALENVPVELNQVLNNCVDIFIPSAKEKSIQLVKQFDETQGVSIITDPTRLRQICANLLSNALKFTHQGQVNIATDLTLQKKGKATLTIAVKDTGVGMTQEQQALLFSPFNQADVSTTRKFGGTGLGLSITRKLCQLMSGDVSVRSVLNKGSVFLAQIEVGIMAKSAHSAEPELAVSQSRDLSDLHVLVVEDNEINQVVIGEMLKQQQITYDIVNDGLEALAILEDEQTSVHPYTLILMDCQMPNMDGYQTTQHIRQLTTHIAGIPIIALTANALSEERDKCFASGMNEYLSKPVDQANLYAMLEKFS